MATSPAPLPAIDLLEFAKAECKRRIIRPPSYDLFRRFHEQFPLFRYSITQAAQRRHSYVASPDPVLNTIAIGIGLKIVEGRKTDVHCVRFYVRRKLPRSAIANEHLLPGKVEGVPTDVIENDGFFALGGLQIGKVMPVQPGCSIGFYQPGFSMAGTLGAIVKDEHQTRYLLSNNHVLCFEDRLPKGSHILQPGNADGGLDPDNFIGKVFRSVALRKAKSDADRMDAAIAEINENCATDPKILNLGKLTTPQPLARNRLSEHQVTKSGRSTGVTNGKVTDLSIDAFVDYYADTLHLEKLIAIEGTDGSPFAELGDSGSMVISKSEMAPVGMIVARGGKMALAHIMQPVLDRLGVTIMT